jgi:hypothetical protein
MKSALLILACLFASFTAYSQSKGYDLNLNNEAKIHMPTAPEVKNIAHGKIYVSVKDSVIYFAQATELKNEPYFNQINYSTLDKVYDSYINGVLQATHATLWTKKPAAITNNLNGYEFIYEPKNSNRYITRYQRVVFVNNTLISYGVWFPNNKLETHTDFKDDYYNTFHLTNQPVQERPVRISSPLNLSTSFYLYTAGGFVLTFLIIIGLAFAFKKPRAIE